MNTQSYLKQSLITPLVLISCVIMLSQQSVADTSSKEMLNALSEEASNTKMVNKQDESTVTVDPTATVKLDNKVAEEDLSAKIEKQLRQVLGNENNGEDNDSDKVSTASELEKIVSSSLLEGAKMDDIRSAVSDAMAEIRRDKKGNKTIAPERITEADKAFSKLTVKKVSDPKTIDKATTSVVSLEATSLPKTVTVQSGESLYKIALRVYGDGDKYLTLYKANEELIKNPDLLLAGQVLTVPE